MSSSPEDATRSLRYESSWAMLYRLIRLNGTFSGHERNVLFWNHGDGTFSDFSAAAGLDFPEDGRAFVTFDYDMDGDLDIVLNNRNSPQLRLLRNDLAQAHHSIAFRLEGVKSNRDAVGARLVLETAAGRRLTRHVRSGSGFRSQPSRIVYFGLGQESEVRQVTVFWPSGGSQTFDGLAAGNLVYLREGQDQPRTQPFHRPSEGAIVSRDASTVSRDAGGVSRDEDGVPREEARPLAGLPEFHHDPGVWLTEATPAPTLRGRGLDGGLFSPAKLRGQRLLVNFWATWCAPCQTELAEFQQRQAELSAARLTPVLVSVDEPGTEETVRSFVAARGLPWTVVLPDAKVVTAYDLLVRHVLDQSAELAVPTSFLVDESGAIVKLYLGRVAVEQVLRDVQKWPKNPADLLTLALPFPGRTYGTGFDRNWTQLAESYSAAGLNEEALAALEHALIVHPDVAGILDRLGMLYGEQGHWEKALRAHEKASKLGSLGADAEVHRAAALAELGRLDDASAVVEKALQLDPQDADALRVSGAIASRRGQFERAEPVLQASLRINPDNPDTHYNLGWLYLQTGRRAEAAAAFQKALALAPKHFQSLHDLGVLHAQSGEWTEAEECFQHAIEARPHSAEAHYSLGLVRAEKREYTQAEALFQKALELRPDYAEALTDLAGVLVQTRRAREALPLLEKARKANPQFAQAYFNEARAYLALGDKQNAIACLKALLSVEPKNAVAADALKRLGP